VELSLFVYVGHVRLAFRFRSAAHMSARVFTNRILIWIKMLWNWRNAGEGRVYRTSQTSHYEYEEVAAFAIASSAATMALSAWSPSSPRACHFA